MSEQTTMARGAEMQKKTKIEQYNDQQLKTKLEIMHDIIRDLKAVKTDLLDDEALEEHKQALQQAHRLYGLFTAEYVRRLKGEVEELLQALEEKEQEQREHGEQDRDE